MSEDFDEFILILKKSPRESKIKKMYLNRFEFRLDSFSVETYEIKEILRNLIFFGEESK